MTSLVEPWLRGTLGEFDAVRRQVLHALELALEDCQRWAGDLSDEEMNARPFGLAPVGFHLRHISRSLDRLLTYAEGLDLSEEQLHALTTEMASRSAEDVRAEYEVGLAGARARIERFRREEYEDGRGVGRAWLPSTVGGLLVHCAEHTQRHVGQVVTTCRVVKGMR